MMSKHSGSYIYIFYSLILLNEALDFAYFLLIQTFAHVDRTSPLKGITDNTYLYPSESRSSMSAAWHLAVWIRAACVSW